MKLFPRLALTFSLVTGLSTLGLGLALRHRLIESETDRFQSEVEQACRAVNEEVLRQASRDEQLLSGACASGEMVDRAMIAAEGGELEMRRTAFAALVGNTRKAFDLDELLLASDAGLVVGGEPRSLLGRPSSDIRELVRRSGEGPLGMQLASTQPAIVSRCQKSSAGIGFSLVGTRALEPVLARLTKTSGLTLGHSQSGDSAEVKCTLTRGTKNHVYFVGKSKAPLHAEVSRLEQTILVASLVATLLATALALLFARSLSRPISTLAKEAGRVASGEAKPIDIAGPEEIEELARSFSRMITDLSSTRRKLTTATRIAAWREVARRVAHEIKNPLAPIRAAVETLRRLHGRQDPAFNEYFDEATRTVLGEVQRITTIVGEFARFARLPPPQPTDTDLVQLLRDQVQLHRETAPEIKFELLAQKELRARVDSDQITQVLTNLIQNAIDALRSSAGEKIVRIHAEANSGNAIITIADTGPGIPSAFVSKLFEPYATSKEHGTGLGLAIAQRIATDHAGELTYVGSEIESHGRGATFRLQLPVDGPPPVSQEIREEL